MAFVHLHNHTQYSLLDGACKIEKLLDKAKEMGQTAVAITDCDNMYGVVEFYKAAKKRNIKPIIGCEIKLAKNNINANNSLILLCKNEIGYKNLVYLVSKSNMSNNFSGEEIGINMLKAHSEGLVALSGDLNSEISGHLAQNDYEKAKMTALKYEEIFGKENYYLELQDHGIYDQQIVNPKIIQLSKETGIPLVATNDCHYIKKEDIETHKILLCIKNGKTLEGESSLGIESNQLYFKSESEMRELFSHVPNAVENTVKIAEMCNFDFRFGEIQLLKFNTPDGSDNVEYFKRLCFQGLEQKYGNNPDQYIIKRLNTEMQTIEKMGYVNYYLTVRDFISYAKSKEIPVGPGRGSGVGSLAAYCMGITGVDPIKYGLMFERFLNSERVSMPDFDVDFSDERRYEVIEYMTRKYGSDHVAQIITFGTFATRQAIIDVGKVMLVSKQKVDIVKSIFSEEKVKSISQALNEYENIKRLYESDVQIKDLIDVAMEIEGMPRHISTHASGIVVTDKPVDCYVPILKNSEFLITQFPKDTVEELGLLKIDFLGLKQLSVIDNASKLIKQSVNNFDINTIAMNDQNVLNIFTQGYTKGVFQFESPGMTETIMRQGPTNIEDLIAAISLFRPGPMQFIDMYIKNSHNHSQISYKHPKLEKILNVTYGCIVYQEQVMSVFRELAGYSLGRADIVRRAMSKKNTAAMDKEKQTFIYGEKSESGEYIIEGCVNRGVNAKVAEEIFNEITSFAQYAFNKSHAAAYAVVAYQTAFLKCYFPKEYLTALLTSLIGKDFVKMSSYLDECKRLNIKIIPPHVNSSFANFTVQKNDISYGLVALKNVGRVFVNKMIEERENFGKFKSFEDFCDRMKGKDLKKDSIENLIKCGALDNLGNNRNEMLSGMTAVLSDNKRPSHMQFGLFDLLEEKEDKIPKLKDFTKKEKIKMEKEVAGIYFSPHELEIFKDLYLNGTADRIDLIKASCENSSGNYKNRQNVSLIATVISKKEITDRNNKKMSFIKVEDLYNSMEVIFFAESYSKYYELLEVSNVIKINGELNFKSKENPQLYCNKVEKMSLEKLYIRVYNNQDYEKALEIAKFYKGESDFIIKKENDNQILKAPKNRKIVLNKDFIDKLKMLLGEDNVIVK